MFFAVKRGGCCSPVDGRPAGNKLCVNGLGGLLSVVGRMREEQIAKILALSCGSNCRGKLRVSFKKDDC